MGKGGQRVANTSTSTAQTVSVNNSLSWKTSYNPLDKNAPKLPTKGEIKAAIPAECFQRSYFWSTFYMFRDLAMTAGFLYAASQVLNTDLPHVADWSDIPQALLWVASWAFYAFWMGTIWSKLKVVFVRWYWYGGVYSSAQTRISLLFVIFPPIFLVCCLDVAIDLYKQSLKTNSW